MAGDYAWTASSAVWQVVHGNPSKARESAYAWLRNQVDNGSALATASIASLLLEAVKQIR